MPRATTSSHNNSLTTQAVKLRMKLNAAKKGAPHPLQHLDEVLRGDRALPVANTPAERRRDHQQISVDDLRRLSAGTTSVELVRTPIGLGLTVDSHYKVLAIAKGSQAKRSRGIAVGDQLVAINDVPLSGGGSFDEQLGAIALGTKVRLVISKPAGSAKTSRIGGLMSV